MRLVPVATAPAGAELARDVTPAPRSRAPLARAGIAFTERLRAVLLEDGVAHVWVHDELGEGLEPAELLPEELRREGAEALHAVLLGARAAMARRRPLGHAQVERVRAVAGELVDGVLALRGLTPPLPDGAGAEHHALQHPLDIAVLGALLGARHLAGSTTPGVGPGRAAQRGGLVQLALGLLLADVGLPPSARPEGQPEDVELTRAHPTVGVELLDTSAEGLVKSVVRGHHERFDGAGYPKGLPSGELHVFARIAAVADAYVALTTARPGRTAAPAPAAHHLVLQDAGSALDPDVVRLFARVVPPAPVATEVRLADGRTGVVAAIDPAAPERPTVRVTAAGGGVEELRSAELAPVADPDRVSASA